VRLGGNLIFGVWDPPYRFSIQRATPICTVFCSVKQGPSEPGVYREFG